MAHFVVLWNGNPVLSATIAESFSSVFQGAGVYQLSFSPVRLGLVNISITLNSAIVFQNTQGLTGWFPQPRTGYRMTVVAGPAAQPSYLVVPATSPAPAGSLTRPPLTNPNFYAIAGAISSLSLYSLDLKSNARVCCDDSNNNAFVISVKAGSSIFAAVSPLVRVAGTNQYTLSFNASRAIQYDVLVSTTFDGAPIGTQSQFTPKVIVVPAATSSARSMPPYGPATSGALANAQNFLWIQARDPFDNFQDDWDDQFIVTVTSNTGVSIPVSVRNGLSSGLFEYNFTISQIYTSYNLTVTRNSAVIFRAGPLPVSTDRPFLYVQSQSSPTSNNLPPAAANGNVKPYMTWIRQVNAQGVVLNSPATFSAQLLQSGNAVSSITVSVQPRSLASVTITDPNPSSLYLLTFGAEIVGNYQISFLGNGSSASVVASNSLSFDSFNITVIPGDLSPPNCVVNGLESSVRIVAGARYVITVFLKDSFGNSITDPSYVVTATANPSNGASFQSGALSAGAWQIPFNITRSEFYTIEVRANSTLVGQNAIQVVPNVPFGDTSVTQLDSSRVIAGTAVQVDITLNDRFGNAAMDNTLSSNISLIVSGTPTSASVNAVGSSSYRLTFTPTVAGNSSVDVLLSGMKLGSSQALEVLAAQADSVIAVNQPQTPAGTPLAFEISVRDTYGNPWDRIDVLRAQVSDPAAVIRSVDVRRSAPGQFLLTASSSATEKAGNYSWGLRFEGLPFTGALSPSVVVPGAIAGNSTAVPVSLAPLRAGEFQEITVQLRDRFQNLVTSGFNAALANVSFNWGLAQCIVDDETINNYTYFGIYPDSAAPYSGSFFKDLGSGQVALKYNITVPSTYTVIFSYNGVPLDCKSYGRVRLQVDPGLPFALYSSYAVDFNETVAGTPLRFPVVVRDLFRNPTQLGGSTITFAALAGSSLTPVNASYALIQESALGSYSISSVIYKSGLATLQVSLDNSLVPPPVNNTILVKPGPLTTYKYVSQPARVGVPFVFNISGTDAFDNPVLIQNYSFSLALISATQDASIQTSTYLKSVSANDVITQSLQCASFGSCYQISMTPSYDSSSNTQSGTAVSAWHGNFLVAVTLQTPTGPETQYKVTYVAHTTCQYENRSTNYLCASGTCVSDYSQCSGLTCPPSQVQCQSGGCQNNQSSCQCPTGQMCSGGYCSTSCPIPDSCPSYAPFKCANGFCRATPDSCPSVVVCNPGWILCADGFSCVTSASQCVLPASDLCPNGTVRCQDGRCVSYFSDCPTPVTCTSGVRCPDGSCQSSALSCPIFPTCSNPTPYRCVDGSCRADSTSCPSGVVCPSGWVLCESRQCALSVSKCPNATKCSLDEVRCPDGSCVPSFLLCPSTVTCPPTSPVLCPDFSCARYSFDCSTPSELSTCPSTMRVCPGGSCIAFNTDVGKWPACPTTTSCAQSTPVLCEDGSCVVSPLDCVADPPACPAANPIRCPDGSCKGNLLDCPSRSVCPDTAPIRCVDGQCVPGAQYCPQTPLSCPSGQVRCPGGECALALSLCPTHVTCPPTHERCADGTCRAPGSCQAVVTVICSDRGLVACPQGGIGVTCATSISKCPLAPVCPQDKPVRCIDASCADTQSLCPAPPKTYSSSSYACPDGTWTTMGIASCPTPVSCPPETPYKCFDETCRMNPADCPVQKTCPAQTPFLCMNGACVEKLDSAECASRSAPCDNPLLPVRCPDGLCYADVALCPKFVASPTSNGCPSGTLRCRDGSCVFDPSKCLNMDKLCPTQAPRLCADGMCVKDLTFCNNPITGCPWNAPYRCIDGRCATNSSVCPATAVPCPTGKIRCPDGSCNEEILCPTQNGCRANEIRCFDGSCATNTSSTNPCTVGYSDNIKNVCPYTNPYRCASGYCAISSSLCPNIDGYLCTDPKFPIACADGSCVANSIMCPLLKPCLPTEERCAGSGKCVPLNNTFLCSPYQVCGTGARCPNGLCVQSIALCPLDTTGCPPNFERCPDGGCVPINTTNVNCKLRPTNGCPLDNPLKCSNGACVNNTIYCPYPNGCPFGTPFRCRNGLCVTASPLCPTSSCTKHKCANGACVNKAADCLGSNGCPARTPVRCADGNCAEFSATSTGAPASKKCAPTVSCLKGQTLCANGACVDSANFCLSVAPCNATRCVDGSCRQNASSCPSSCPVGSPVICRNGLCTKNAADCAAVARLTVSVGGTSGFTCVDGSIRESTSECIMWANSIRNEALVLTQPDDMSLTTCGSGEDLCWDGSCASARSCPIIPACPLETYRSWNGSCTQTPPPKGPACPSGFTRCEDGWCRPSAKCMPYDGCALEKFYCKNRECTDDPAGCGQPKVPNGRKTLATNLLSDGSPAVCSLNCKSQLKALSLDYTVDVSQQFEVAVAIDQSNVPVGRLNIPDGSIASPGRSASVLSVRPVADSVMRDAQNSLPPSRVEDFKGRLGFTFPQTLLSAAFQCSVESSVAQPFPVPLSYQATIDYAAAPPIRDICLAYLFRIEKLSYARWQCVFSNDRRSNEETWVASADSQTPEIVRSLVSDCQDPVDSAQGKVYGFIHSPLTSPKPLIVKLPSWWTRNALWITLVLLALGITVLLILYCAKRLHRYRRKYKDEQARVNQKQEEVDEMEQFGGTAGQKDDEVNMTANPLTLQLKDIKKALEEKEHQMSEEVQRQKKEQTEARRDHIENLTKDRDNLMAELEKLKKDLEAQQKAQAAARPKATDLEPPPSTTTDLGTERPSQPVVRNDFQAAKPKRKKEV